MHYGKSTDLSLAQTQLAFLSKWEKCILALPLNTHYYELALSLELPKNCSSFPLYSQAPTNKFNQLINPVEMFSKLFD